MKSELGPVYSMLLKRRRAAAEWRTGIEILVRTEAMMVASFKVHPPCMNPRDTTIPATGVSLTIPSTQNIRRLDGRTHLAQREQDPLEPSRRLIKPLLQRLIQLHIQLSPFTPLATLSIHHVIPDFLQEDPLEEDLDLGRFQVGHEDLGTGVGRVRGPGGRLGES